MSHRILKREGCVIDLELTVPAEQVEQRLAAQLNRMQQTVSLPGFRQGKVPRSLLQRKYGEDLLHDLAVDLVNERFKEVVEQEKLTVFSAPWIVSAELGLGKSNAIVVRFEEYPAIDLSDGGYRGLKIEVTDFPVLDKDVDEAIASLREQQADLAEVSGRAAQAGDLVDATIVITPAGQAAGPEQQYKLRLGEETLAPGLDAQLAGRPLNQPFTLTHTLPGEPAGGPAGEYRITLTAIREYKLPALDDAFAKANGAETAAGLRDKVRTELTAWVERGREEELRRRLKAALVARYPIPVPPSLTVSFLRDMHEELHEQAKQPGFDEKKWAEQARPVAEATARLTLLTEAIARQEQLAVTDADVEAEAARVAAMFQATPGEVLLRWREKDARDQVKFSLRQRQVLNYLAEKADKTVKPRSAAEEKA